MPALSADPRTREQAFDRLRQVENRRREPWVLESLAYLNHPLREAQARRFVAANILDGTPLLAPGSHGINGVRLANASHLSSWTGTEAGLDFDEVAFLAELNKRIADEGKFPERS
jgi:hypothetical protein